MNDAPDEDGDRSETDGRATKDTTTVDDTVAADETVRAVVQMVATTAPEIRAGLPGRRTKTESENVSGERQMAADIWADELLCDRLGAIDAVATYASEERDDAVDVRNEDGGASSDGGNGGDGDGYLVAVDPLDGSSNLKSNNPMGTIFAVYDTPDLPVTGRDLVAAGFVLYGPITTLVLAEAGEAREYVVEAGELRDVGVLELPDDPVVYGFGGRAPDWTDDFAAYVDSVADELKLRYGGAMIADVSQVLTYGGIFGYPHLESAPNGKLRLLFEGAPVGYIVACAGGSSSDGSESLLDVECTGLHQRTPVFVGTAAYVERVEAALA